MNDSIEIPQELNNTHKNWAFCQYHVYPGTDVSPYYIQENSVHYDTRYHIKED